LLLQDYSVLLGCELKKGEEMKDLARLARMNGVEVIDRGNGHIQLKGKLLVNYYPESKKKTAYVAGTVGAKKFISFDDAIRMANEIPMKFPDRKAERKKSYKGSKNKLLAKKPFCHWCNEKLTKETATLDHVIPLAKGGLNNMNNYVLACEPCNQKRGCNMPELKGE